MDLIDWRNLPTQTTPLNKTMLELFQNNINEGKIDQSRVLSSPDLDTLKDTAVYYVTSSTNGPTGNGYVFIIKYANTYVKQFFCTAQSNITYERVLVGGTWGDWGKVGRETVYSIGSYLENDWQTNGTNAAVVLPNGTKILTVSVRRGTSTQIMTLPSALRPSNTVLAIGSSGSNVGNISITMAGVVTVANSIFTSGSSNCIFSVMYT